MRISLVGLIVSVLAAPVAGQTSRPVPERATSYWTVQLDRDSGSPIRTFVNRTFVFLPGADRLFEQEVRTQFGPWEGDKGRVKIVAWSADKPGTTRSRRLWTAELVGGEARLLRDRYDVIEHGCCGAWDTHTWLSLAMGSPLVTFTNGPVHVWAQDGATYSGFDVVYLSDRAASRSAAMQADSMVLGELAMLTGDTVLSRATLRWAGHADWDGAAEMWVVTGRDSAAAGSLGIEAGRQPIVRITAGGRVVTIPIDGQSLTLAGASIPSDLTVRLDNDRPPAAPGSHTPGGH